MTGISSGLVGRVWWRSTSVAARVKVSAIRSQPFVRWPVAWPAHLELAAVHALGVGLQAGQDHRVGASFGGEGRRRQAPPQLGRRLDRLAPCPEQGGCLVAVEVKQDLTREVVSILQQLADTATVKRPHDVSVGSFIRRPAHLSRRHGCLPTRPIPSAPRIAVASTRRSQIRITSPGMPAGNASIGSERVRTSAAVRVSRASAGRRSGP